MRTPWTISRQTPKNNNKSENFPQYSFIPLLISYESVVFIYSMSAYNFTF